MIIKKYNIDYAHFQYIAPLIKYCRYIVTIHDVLFNDFKDSFPLSYRLIKNFLFRISAEKSDIFLTVSNYSKERISKYYQIPLDKIRVIPNGVGEDFFNMPIESSDNDIFFSHNLEKFILYVSRVEPRKNHLILLKAFNELQLWDRGYKLVFIGRQDLPYPELDSFLEEGSKELIESVFRISNVSHESLKLFYHHCALFVYPSIAEGFGIPPLEAITAGAPTLCSNSTAMSEFSFLEDDLFVPTDLEELKQKILRKISTADSIQRVLFLKDIVRKKIFMGKFCATTCNLYRDGVDLNFLIFF